MICEKHARFFKDNSICIECWKEDEKKKKEVLKPMFYKAKPTPLNNLRQRVNAAFSKLIKKLYDKGNYSHCFTCGKMCYYTGTVYGAHCGHYFMKSTYWLLAYRIENAGIQCYDCNVNKQGNIGAMRPKLVALHGEDKIKQLEIDAETFLAGVKQGIYKTKPDETFLKNELKRINLLLKG